MSESNRVRLCYLAESSWNVPPELAAATPQILRHTGNDSFSHNIENIVSSELRSDRNIPGVTQASKSCSGGFNFEFSYGTFDDLIESALYSSWSTDVIENGTTESSFMIEKGMLDIAEYFAYTGMVVNQWSLNLSAGQIVTGSFEFVGGWPVEDGAAIPVSIATNQQTAYAGGSYVAATTTDVFNAIGNVATLQYDGSDFGAYVSDLSFTVNNNVRSINAVSYDRAVDVVAGKCDITGSMNLYFADDTIYDDFIAGSSGIELTFTLTDAAGNDYTFLFPEIKLESDTVNSGGSDSDVMENISWRAIYDSGEDSMIKITRSAA